MYCAPNSFADIVGQPAALHLASYAEAAKNGNRAGKCWLLVGPSGTGKTSCAHALAAELGCHNEATGRWKLDCSELTFDKTRRLFGNTLRFQAASQTGLSCVILENLEWLAPDCARLLKTALDPLGTMPANLCVVATAEDVNGVPAWLLDRFRQLPFNDGESFHAVCRDRLHALWGKFAGTEMPIGWTGWGVDFRTSQFSMRQALRDLEFWLARRPTGIA